MDITVYSLPNCMQCEMTKKAFERAGIAFEAVMLNETQNASALEWIQSDLGYSSAPVVWVEDGSGQNHWSGFRPDLIKRLCKSLEAKAKALGKADTLARINDLARGKRAGVIPGKPQRQVVAVGR